MAQLHTDDNFMHHSSILSELKKQTQSKWENKLLDDFDDYDTVPRDYNRICIDDATPADWDALADRRLTGRGVDTPQERSLKEVLENSEDWGMYDSHSDDLSYPSKLVDWSRAPDWATYWAVNSKGIGFWFGECFSTYQGEWSRNRVLGDGSATPAPNFGWPVEKWEESLVARPKESCQGINTEVSQDELNSLANRGSKLVKVTGLNKEPLSQQIGGEHYRQGSIQPIEYIHANDMDFFSGNVCKYVTRWKYKNGLEDLKKAKHYIELLMEQEYGYHG